MVHQKALGWLVSRTVAILAVAATAVSISLVAGYFLLSSLDQGSDALSAAIVDQ